jgi:hypothetical protein
VFPDDLDQERLKDEGWITFLVGLTHFSSQANLTTINEIHGILKVRARWLA